MKGFNRQRVPWKWLAGLALILVVFTLTVPVESQDATLPPPGQVAEDAVDLTVDAAETTVTVVQDLLNRIAQPPSSDLARVLFVIGGIVLLLAGWRVYDFIIVLAGAVVGGTIATALVGGDSAVVDLAAFIIGALLGAGLAIAFYYAAVLLIGAYVGIVLITALYAALGSTPASDIVLLLGAVVGAVIMLALSFEFLVLFSALLGAQLLVYGLGLDTIWILLLALAGAVIQFGLTRTFHYEIRRRPRPLFRRRVV
ncbi:MAG: hypothetical protein IT320_23035 [Anaerolineae bacterium]|nr:hypothetical protein [Anaerolineae bacterium]